MFKKFSFLTLGRTSGDLFNFLLFILIARMFGQESIGHYSFAMALVGMFLEFASFGLYVLTIKELSHKSVPFEQAYSPIWSLRIVLSLGVMGILVLITPMVPVPDQGKSLIVIIGMSFIFGTIVDGFAAVFIAHENMKVAGLLDSSHRVSGAVGGIIVVLLGGNLLLAVSMFPIMTLVHCLGGYALVHKHFGRPRLSRSWPSMFEKLREAVPYCFSELLGQVLIRTNILLLGFLASTTAAGLYNVAYRIVFGFLFIPVFAGIALLPTASKLFAKDKEQLVALYCNSLKMIIFLGLPASCGVFLIAPDLINLFYGENYSEAFSVLRILSGLIFLHSVRIIMGIFLTAVNLQSERTKREWYGALSIIAGNLLLIPIWGIMGSALATILSECLLLILFTKPLTSVLGWPRIGQAFLMSGIACSSFLIPFLFVNSGSLILKVLISAIFYFAILIVFKDVRRNEIPRLLNLFQNDSSRNVSSSEETCRP